MRRRRLLGGALAATAGVAAASGCASGRPPAPPAPPAAAAPPAPATTTLATPAATTDRPLPPMNDADPFLWLEDVQGERALAWVQARNAESRARLERHPRFEATRNAVRAMLDSPDKIPAVSRRGPWFYNLWKDAGHPRGLWRRCKVEAFALAEPGWETVLDLDDLARTEGENWVWHGATSLGPEHRLCLVQLSRGGADATVLREFDLERKAFVPGGFTLPEAKTDVHWETADSLLVGTDTGPGSLTDSGYARQIRRWKRGTPIAQAPVVFEGEAADVLVFASIDRSGPAPRTLVGRAIDFYRSQLHQLHPDGRRTRVAIPDDAQLQLAGRHALLQLRSDWTVGGQRFAAGSLVAGDAQAVLAATGPEALPRLQALFTPTATRSLDTVAPTGGQVLLGILDNVAGTLEAWQPRPDGSGWTGRPLQAPGPGTLHLATLHDPTLASDPLAEAYLLNYTDFLTPDSLLQGDARTGTLKPLKSRPAFFDASGLQVQQRFATSADGTRVPYFLIGPKGLQATGDHPTLLYGYGGFEVSMQPGYFASWGIAWLSQGGVVAVANIRGGGEFGPAWHQAAVKGKRQRAFDDFAAVAQHLAETRITRPQRLGIQGGSNGGLLVGAVMLQRPELLGAVVCQVPLLDMRRYHLLLAGASWMAEYGNPDLPEEWAWIGRWSPYQTVQAGQKLPPVLFTTSTRDDRVHPGHARKMAARMAALGYSPLYYENTEGGHAGAADNRQKADMVALEFSFLWQTLGEAARG